MGRLLREERVKLVWSGANAGDHAAPQVEAMMRGRNQVTVSIKSGSDLVWLREAHLADVADALRAILEAVEQRS